ncbi:zinc finger CCHC domain-containing protein 4 isoform X2 [Oryzias latipes]|uniref:zinc finger CCHC domain-containing protein 4 isoform X2 n=1 Tax=Oryzias latipes TaxID=8090 RepID=UPI0009D9648B|nr:zinc finger CCHC domain-containing protein 4 isoform X2 [Oryzias latipes]
MEELEDSSDGLGFEPVLPEAGTAAPWCPHGPTLLFQKASKGTRRGRSFYACSACRDRKDCSFFQWADEKVSESRLQAREAERRSQTPRFTQQECQDRLQVFTNLPAREQKFCVDCQLLLLPDEHRTHSAHRTTAVLDVQLRTPSLLLRPLDNKKSHAQFMFSQRSADFLLDALTALGFRKVLCIGTPRLHEAIQLRNLKQDQEPVKSLLLDIDFRYAQFYSGEEFCHYNMFNHHFFDGRAASDVLDAFIREDDGKKVVMVADPPFGGLVKPLAGSFSLISQTWRAGQRWRAGHSSADGHTEMPMLWIFPYFFEPRILDCLPSFTMLDYQVDYDNHPLYKHGKSGRKQSPVRIFTNISAKTVVLPKEEGYRFCSACQRYVSPLNKHCARCNICPSKDGREWRHCPACEKCVKPSWKHCPLCSRCALPDHPCGPGPQREGCFGCGSLQHKRRTCPLKGGGGLSRPKVRRREKTFSALQKANRKWAAARGAKRAAAQTQ